MFNSDQNFEKRLFGAFHLKQLELGLTSYPRGLPLSHIPDPSPHNGRDIGCVTVFIHACEENLSICSNNVWGINSGRFSDSWRSLSSSPFSQKIGGEILA
jgi:hypothetical protein